jgi:hypothetical protein
MKSAGPSSIWKKQTVHPDCKHTECPTHDPIRDWAPDPSGVYVLIRVDAAARRIELALCDRDHRIFRTFSGRTPQDLYHAVFAEEARSSAKWFQSPAHIAYLGKELQKAGHALCVGETYVQE